ncbi:hypothetical protein CISIN_1g032851mg [Citrus sinensis]|uniref:Uncharacterized protein n=1 Tax=Citrus sinensis TaxID=2711 RepID=A0A067DKC8_CITSI|nr:hypothetical protein CISIN_1g032851mg [Citrus sinensis]
MPKKKARQVFFFFFKRTYQVSRVFFSRHLGFETPQGDANHQFHLISYKTKTLPQAGQKKPPVQSANIKISPSFFHVNINTPNPMCTINKHFIDTLFSTNLDQLFNGNHNTRNRCHMINHSQSDFPTIGFPCF